jgi:uncharacterized membrane protein
MAVDVQEILREIAKKAIESGGQSVDHLSRSNGGFSGVKGIAAGAGAAAAIPILLKNAGKLGDLADIVKSPGEALSDATSNVGERLASSAKDKAKDAIDEAGGPGGILKGAVKQLMPFGGGDGDGGGDGAEGVGKGRRMPVQQSIDIGVPIETVYNQWTQFAEWPQFMHRVSRVTQEDDCTVSFAVKIWGKTKDFTADIETQRPNERIKWRVSQGMTHTGVVTFHELGPNLTRILLGFDVDPGGLVEKFARGARHIKRAARADLHRFKAFIEMAEHETGAWRGVIEDGELVEEHDPSYDEEREYSDIEELTGQQDSDEEDEDEDAEGSGDDEEPEDESEEEPDEDDDEDEDEPEAQRPQAQRRSRGSSQQQRKRGSQDQQSRGRRARQSQSSSSSERSSRSSRGQSASTKKSGSTSRGRSRSRGASNGSSRSSSRGRSRNG